MATLHVYGIDHSRAPLEVREELVFGEQEIGELAPLLRRGPVGEVMVLSTCNRTEIYMVASGPVTTYPLAPLQRYRPQARAMDDHCLRYHLEDADAAAHLHAVAASLQSEVPGDTQIASQVAAAARMARQAGTMGPLLEHLAAGALRTAKRVRRETGLSAGGPATGAAVLQTLRRHGPVRGRNRQSLRVLLLGAGVMAGEVAAHLVRSGGGVGPSAPEIVIAGVWARNKQKARCFAERIGSRSLGAGELAASMRTADAIMSACRGRLEILSEPTLGPLVETRAAPLLVIDLGVPRNLDPAMAARDGVHAVFLDQLHQKMRERSRLRREAVEEAERIVAAESGRFEAWRRALPLQPLRSDVYASVESVLSRWRLLQPHATRELRVALHRTLEQTFGAVAATAQSFP